METAQEFFVSSPETQRQSPSRDVHSARGTSRERCKRQRLLCAQWPRPHKSHMGGAQGGQREHNDGREARCGVRRGVARRAAWRGVRRPHALWAHPTCVYCTMRGETRRQSWRGVRRGARGAARRTGCGHRAACEHRAAQLQKRVSPLNMHSGCTRRQASLSVAAQPRCRCAASSAACAAAKMLASMRRVTEGFVHPSLT